MRIASPPVRWQGCWAPWGLPGLVGLLAGESSSVATLLGERADEGTVAILAASLLFLLPVDWPHRRFTLSWEQAVRFDWGMVLLFGAGITLGTLLSDTGLAGRLGGCWPRPSAW